MSDMITAEEAQKLLEGLEIDLSGANAGAPLLEALRDYARTLIALHAQLADAKAAQAMVVRKAAEACEDVDFAHDDPSIQRMVREFIGFAGSRVRALADADGLAMVQELRAERDGVLARNRGLVRLNEITEARAIAAEADRDRLAAEKAEIEALLREAVDAADAFLNKRPPPTKFEPWLVKARAALSSLTPTPSDTDGPIWHERLGWDGNKEGEG